MLSSDGRKRLKGLTLTDDAKAPFPFTGGADGDGSLKWELRRNIIEGRERERETER